MMTSEIEQVRDEIHAMRGDFSNLTDKLSKLTEVIIRKEEQDKFLDKRLETLENNFQLTELKHSEEIKELQIKSVGTESAKSILKTLLTALLVTVVIGGLGLYQYGKPVTQPSSNQAKSVSE